MLMSRNVKSLTDPKGGFTLIEVMAATSLLSIAVLALAALVVPLNRQREQVEARQLVLIDARSLTEEIKGSDPAFVESTYDTQTYNVTGVDGANGDGTTLSVTVNSPDPKLLEVTVSGSWNIDGHVETMDLSTDIFNPSG